MWFCDGRAIPARHKARCGTLFIIAPPHYSISKVGDAGLGVPRHSNNTSERRGEFQDQKDRSGAPATEAHRPESECAPRLPGNGIEGCYGAKLCAASSRIFKQYRNLGICVAEREERISGAENYCSCLLPVQRRLVKRRAALPKHAPYLGRPDICRQRTLGGADAAQLH
jgi:hypothetical protein